METTKISDFEISHNGIDYMIDFEVDYHIEEEKATWEYPGSSELIIDGYSILEVVYYDPETDDWSVSEMPDNLVIELLEEYENEIKEKL